MTDNSMGLLELAEKHADGDFMRELGQFALQRLEPLDFTARQADLVETPSTNFLP